MCLILLCPLAPVPGSRFCEPHDAAWRTSHEAARHDACRERGDAAAADSAVMDFFWRMNGEERHGEIEAQRGEAASAGSEA